MAANPDDLVYVNDPSEGLSRPEDEDGSYVSTDGTVHDENDEDDDGY